MKTARPLRQAGVSLIEVSATLAIAAVLAGTAVPSFTDTLERRTLEGRGGELSNDLQYLRSEVVSRNHSMRIGFRTDAGGSCYVIHTGAAGDCGCDSSGAAAQCTNGAEAVKSVSLPASNGVRLQSNVASILFDPLHGTASPTGTVRLIDRHDRAVHHVVNILGRVRTCSPGKAIAGHPAC